MKSKSTYEQLLRENESLRKQLVGEKNDDIYHAFVERNDAVILLISQETGDIYFANESALKYYGYNEEQLVGMNISSISTVPFKEIKIRMAELKKKKHNCSSSKSILATGEIRAA